MQVLQLRFASFRMTRYARLSFAWDDLWSQELRVRELGHPVVADLYLPFISVVEG
jgi:hypothetical protein